MSASALLRVPVFPLAGALLFPRSQLPLHIFEERYRAMTRDAMAGDRLIAMIQPKDNDEPPALFEIGCIGRILACEELDDGRFNLVLGLLPALHGTFATVAALGTSLRARVTDRRPPLGGAVRLVLRP